MSENSSAPTSNLLPHCYNSELTIFLSKAIFGATFCTYTPVSIMVLLLCYQQWRRRRSFAAMSHSDVFAFHQAVIHLITNFATLLFFSVHHTGQTVLSRVWLYISSIGFPAEMALHVLTSVERYVAVIHPVIYLGSIGCVWLLCFGWIGVVHVHHPDLPYIQFFCTLAFSLVIVTFCGFSVLCVLVRPGPGKVGGDNQHADQSRAFNTISTIMAVHLLYFAAVVACLAVENSSLLSYNTGCVILASVNWLGLINGLVLPLLYLNRAEKLFCCRGNNR